jgi:UDP-N-acetylmuramate dehydrogenase
MFKFAHHVQAVQQNISLKTMNTFGIDAQANYFASFSSKQELIELLNSDLYRSEKHMVLGGGSNVLFTQDVKALVLKNEIYGKEIIKEDNDFAWVKFGAGEPWHDCVLWAIEQNLGGIENLSLIPGTCGAAPMQNIGAYGVEIKSVIDTVEAVEKSSGSVKEFTNGECEFGYRESIFKHSLKDKFIISQVTLKLSKRHTLQLSYGAIRNELAARKIKEPSIQDVSNVVISIRESKLPNPKEIGNAGSFFKNPVVTIDVFKSIQADYQDIPFYEQEDGIKIPAGWLIEQAGWKGFTDGEIGVHKKQALVLVNYGNGNGLDIYNLSEQIISDVRIRYGIDLQREVNIL